MKWTALVLLLLLAGCTKDPSSVDVPEEPVTDFGGIRGVALDTTFVPVAGANVTIDGFNVVAVTNADGEFAFGNLALGAYFLRIVHADFFEQTAQVTVVSGVPEVTKVSMQPKLKIQPFAEPFQFDGFLNCGYRVVITGDNCEGSNAEVTYELDVIPNFVQSELDWSSGTGLGDELSFQFTVPGTAVDYIEDEGTAPVTLRATPDDIVRHGLGDGLDLFLRVFTADLEGSEVPGYWGVGAQIDQDFSIYTHVFYGFEPVAGWTFLVDGEPVP